MRVYGVEQSCLKSHSFLCPASTNYRYGAVAPPPGGLGLGRPSLGPSAQRWTEHLNLVLLHRGLNPLHIERSLWRKVSRLCWITEGGAVEAFVLGGDDKVASGLGVYP
jgi:hypothetical protein